MGQLFHKQEKGHLGQYEDWWYLETDDNGEQIIEHRWDHVSVGGGGADRGSEKTEVRDFLSGNHNAKAQEKLAEILNEDL